MAEERKGARESISGGIRQGIGVLSALKDALEETINEARERGDLSQDRVKEVFRQGLGKAQERAEEARIRFDFVTQREFESLREIVEDLKGRVGRLEGEGPVGGGGDPPGESGAEGDPGTAEGDAGGNNDP